MFSTLTLQQYPFLSGKTGFVCFEGVDQFNPSNTSYLIASSDSNTAVSFGIVVLISVLMIVVLITIIIILVIIDVIIID